MKKIQRTPLFEVLFMFVLCLVAAEWVVYPQFDPMQIYIAIALCVAGIAASHFIQMRDFFGYFITAAICTFLTPIVWKIINGSWEEFLFAVNSKSIPFVEIPVSSYFVMGILIFFIVYSTKRIPAIVKKA